MGKISARYSEPFLKRFSQGKSREDKDFLGNKKKPLPVGRGFFVVTQAKA